MRASPVSRLFCFLVAASLALAAGCGGGDDLADPTDPEAMAAVAHRAVERARTAVEAGGDEAWIAFLMAFEQGYAGRQLIAALDEARVPDPDGNLPAARIGDEEPAEPPLLHLERGKPGDALGWAVLASHRAGPIPLAHGEPVSVVGLRDEIVTWARAGGDAFAVTAVARLVALADLGYTPRQIVESLTGGGSTGSFYYSADQPPAAEDVIAVLAAGAQPASPPYAAGRHCEVLRDAASRLLIAEQPDTGHARRCASFVEEHREEARASAGEGEVYVGQVSSLILVDPSGVRGCQDFANPVTAVLWPGGQATLDVEFRVTLDLSTGECRTLDEPGHMQFLGFRDDAGHLSLTAGEVAADADLVGAELVGSATGSPGIEGWLVEFDFTALRCPALDERVGQPPAVPAEVPALTADGC